MGKEKICPIPGAAGASGKSIAKPNLRDLHLKQTMKHIYIACGLTVISGIMYHFLINNPRKAAYQNFYENYDADAAFNRMRDAGLLSSCPKEEEKKEEKQKKRNCLFGG